MHYRGKISKYLIRLQCINRTSFENKHKQFLAHYLQNKGFKINFSIIKSYKIFYKLSLENNSEEFKKVQFNSEL